uniref:Uncharacterized protein n=1 Tax=Arundo donax TaxID=35708 RepID=A0A0A9D9Y3_ARUDO
MTGKMPMQEHCGGLYLAACALLVIKSNNTTNILCSNYLQVCSKVIVRLGKE